MFSQEVLQLSAQAKTALRDVFAGLEQTAEANQFRVMRAFADNRVSEGDFAGTTGYGYNDRGRDTLDRVLAACFGCESALVRHNFVSGTHALTVALFALLRPGDLLLSATGKPYDTLEQVIGIAAGGGGSLAEFGVRYQDVPLSGGRTVDYAGLERALQARPKVVYAQRSRGYGEREGLSCAQLNELYAFVKRVSPASYVVVDNCYGEFLETEEPKADLLVGSFIKNPGGGLADTGGYVAGSAACVELAACRLTSPGIGGEMGATLDQTKKMLRGLFYAPHTVLQALKTAAFAAYILDRLGYDVSPGPFEKRLDLVQSIHFRSERKLVAFCRGIQAGSPVDAFAVPEPWDMPGYQHKVIMAAGTFTQGASIELSADAPIREPYTLYLQGGLTFESGVYGVLHGVERLLAEH